MSVEDAVLRQQTRILEHGFRQISKLYQEIADQLSEIADKLDEQEELGGYQDEDVLDALVAEEDSSDSE